MDIKITLKFFFFMDIDGFRVPGSKVGVKLRFQVSEFGCQVTDDRTQMVNLNLWPACRFRALSAQTGHLISESDL